MADVGDRDSDEDTSRYDGQFRPVFSKLHEDRDLLWVTPLPVRYTIAVVGYRCSGKSTVLSYLSDKKGFEVYSLSSLVREIAEARGLPLGQRDILQRLGDELRAQEPTPGEKPGTTYGDGGLFARMLLRRIHARYHRHTVHKPIAPRLAISGFKHPDELRVFDHLSNFRIFNIEAGAGDAESSLATRAQRAYETGILARELNSLGLRELATQYQPPRRGSDVHPLPEEDICSTFEQYLDQPDRDSSARTEWIGSQAQAVDRVLEQATGRGETVTLTNDIDTKLETLYKQIDTEVARLDSLYRGSSR